MLSFSPKFHQKHSQFVLYAIELLIPEKCMPCPVCLHFQLSTDG
uniref:Uncharacterized protein n=1 Tax=Arundo donax TaxID=35708 RepID=A0A0A8YBB6_ARUDO